MKERDSIYTGILTEENGIAWIAGDNGERYFYGAKIWSGYLKHWRGLKINARLLDKCDYKTGEKIVIIWPDMPHASGDFFELYYNERLVKYPGSICGHNAINVSGEIFNFSHLVYENEVISPEEYFYRPALGEFAPSPVTGGTDLSDLAHPYYDKFGRNFMRTIHVLRVDGVDTEMLGAILRKKIEYILNLDPDPANPAENPDFHWRKRNCTTNIADALREYGLTGVSGSFPRDFFVSACWSCTKKYGRDRVRIFRMPQLLVDEAEPSSLTPMINPLNYYKMFWMNID